MANYSRKITVYTQTTTSDGAGGSIATWDAGKVCWADISVQSDSRLFINNQEYNGTSYVIQIRAQTLKYIPPVENYKVVINAFGVNRNLKILSASQPDLLSYNQTFTCIESNG